MRKTNAWEKLFVSIINTIFVVIVSLPAFISFGWSPQYRISLAGIFLAYQLVILLFPSRRSIGAIITKTSWNKEYPLVNHIIYAVLYSFSFSTLLIWVIFPFDLLLINLLLIQYPMIRRTGYTLHGYLSGKMAGHREK